MRRVCLPGSLNAMWPSSPIPPRKSSMPPYFLILASYSLHSSIKFFAFPFRMLTCEGGMSTGFVGRRQVKADARRGLRDAPCEKNSRNMKVW